MTIKNNNIDYLRNRELINPYRIKTLIQEAIKLNNLDLKGLIILTEAASKNYVVTPIIAAMAGGKVFAITNDSSYGKAEEIKSFTNNFANFCGVSNNINIIFKKQKEIIRQANIITNLGFVRPINKAFVDMLNEKAVISFMSEAWEYRKGDIDLKACKLKNIPIMATNEEDFKLKVFDYCGLLCYKMLFELEIEVYKNKIVIVSNDKFGEVIKKYLKKVGANVNLIKHLKTNENRKFLKNCDALIVADYTSNDILIGKKGQISGNDLIKMSKKISVIQFAGDIDINDLKQYNIPYFPNKKVGKNRMGMTLADLGPKPIIDLHCAGLKVGEVMARARLNGKSIDEVKKITLKHSPAQDFK